MRVVLILLLCLAGCAGGPDPACTLVPVAELPVRLVSNVPVVSMQINGQKATMVLDTGSDATVLTRAAARRLGVAAQTESRPFVGAGGTASFATATLDRAALGPLVLDRHRALLTDGLAPPLDGVVGIDVLVGLELDLDVPRGRVGLFRARACATLAPGWPGAAVPLPVHQRAGSGHLFVPVLLDGQPLAGLLDTGTSVSVLSLQAAGEQGYSGRRLGGLPRGVGQAMNAGGIEVRQVRFGRMQIGPGVLSGPMLAIADLPAAAGDMLVGSDVLATRRVWLSFLMGKAFVER